MLIDEVVVLVVDVVVLVIDVVVLVVDVVEPMLMKDVILLMEHGDVDVDRGQISGQIIETSEQSLAPTMAAGVLINELAPSGKSVRRKQLLCFGFQLKSLQQGFF